AGLYACSPFAIYASAGPLTESLFTCFIATSVYCLLRLWATGSRRLMLAAGLSAGLACLTRPNGFAFFALGAAGPLGLPARRRPAPEPRRWLAALCIALLVVLPWTVRNYAVTGLLIPVTGGVLGGPALFYISTRSDLDQRDETTLWPALGRDP